MFANKPNYLFYLLTRVAVSRTHRGASHGVPMAVQRDSGMSQGLNYLTV
jgi:hypothetical protein